MSAVFCNGKFDSNEKKIIVIWVHACWWSHSFCIVNIFLLNKIVFKPTKNLQQPTASQPTNRAKADLSKGSSTGYYQTCALNMTRDCPARAVSVESLERQSRYICNTQSYAKVISDETVAATAPSVETFKSSSNLFSPSPSPRQHPQRLISPPPPPPPQWIFNHFSKYGSTPPNPQP